MNYLVYNPLSSNNHGEEFEKKALKELSGRFDNLQAINLVAVDTRAFWNGLKEGDNLVVIGGDGTLNYIANFLDGRSIIPNLFLYGGGNGNDFLNDVREKEGKDIVFLNPYLKNLPKVTVNGNVVRFLNGIGFGIDGMACQIADDMKEKGKKKINYAAITIKHLLFKYKGPEATVIVDGKEYHFRKVYLASAMNGRYYGGGMKIAPDQDRKSNLLTSVVFHGKGRIKVLSVFPGIFKGKHVKHHDMVSIIQGKKIEVIFSHPCALQVDGETYRNVTSYVAEIE